MEQIKAFIEKANTDSELMAKLDALGAKNADAENVIALAAEYGFTFSKEDYEKMSGCGRKCARCGELSEEELGAVSGGWDGNRYDPNVCKPSLGRTRYECVGLLKLAWCDHYHMELCYPEPDPNKRVYAHSCAKGAFNYVGFLNGESV